jgi:hypothetical protein
MLISLPFGALEGHIKPKKRSGFDLRDPDLVHAWDGCTMCVLLAHPTPNTWGLSLAPTTRPWV